MSGQDLAIFLNIMLTILGFLTLHAKIMERITRVETHIFHIMRVLKMKPRENQTLEGYNDEE